jgi:hypothetical protein
MAAPPCELASLPVWVIGFEDRTMAPLIPPGSFVQIDAEQTRVKKSLARKSPGHSQFRRPIYFVDIRDGYACGWCQIEDGQLTLVPHPDSPEKIRTFRHPAEAEGWARDRNCYAH